MPLSNDYIVNQLLIPAVVMFFLVWGLIGAAVGAGLIVSSGKMLRLFSIMNQYVSTRHSMKPLAMAHDVGQGVRKHRRLIGAVFVVGAAYSMYGLFAWFESATIVSAVGMGFPPPFVIWILESVRWSMVLFSVFAIVIGVMLVNFQEALGKLEAHANRWYSVRKYTVGADSMHLTLDKWVQAFPRASGSVIAVTALYVAVNAAILWLRFH
jgi:hypothetical protein